MERVRLTAQIGSAIAASAVRLALVLQDGVAGAVKNGRLSQRFEQGGAAFGHVAPGGVKIAGVPGIGHIAGIFCVIHEAPDFAFGIAAKEAAHADEIGFVHAD